MTYRDRIQSDAAICGGQPVIKGTRVLVKTVLAYLARGSLPAEIIAEFPSLDDDEIRAVIAFAAASADPKARMLAQWREDELKLQRVALATAEERGRREARKERQDEGRADGFKQGIDALCDVLEIPLDDARRCHVDQSDAVALESLLRHLRTERCWPHE